MGIFIIKQEVEGKSQGAVVKDNGEYLDIDFLLEMMRRFWKDTAVVVQCVDVLNATKLRISYFLN